MTRSWLAVGVLSLGALVIGVDGTVLSAERRLRVLCRAGLLDGACAGNVAGVRGRFEAQPGWLPVVTRACRTVRPAAEPAAEQTDRIGVSGGEDCRPGSVVTALAGAADVFPVDA